jgi:beta-N-acetylhexosaminidase
MTASLVRDAHAVLFPAFASLSLDDTLRRYLAQGGVSLLLGETREEYLARAMSGTRKENERAEDIQRLVADARRAGSDVIIAVDQELGGIERLHRLAPPLPSIDAARAMPDSVLAAACEATARAAAGLGITLFLAPIVDVMTEDPHPWLNGRTLGRDPAEVSRLAAAYVRGVQAGGVAATAKHFPGFPKLRADPAIEEARLAGGREVLNDSLAAFRAVIDAGVQAVMLGPAVVESLDPVRAASLSPAVVGLLRHDLGFSGLIISDDLDSRATLLDWTVEEVAVMALQAGAELLLVAAGDHLDALVRAIVGAVETGALPEETLTKAARKVRQLAGGVQAS